MINDWNFLLDGHAPAFRVRRGDVEAWEFTNEFRSMPHPIHVHGFSFRVLGRSKSPPQVVRRFVDRRGGPLAQDLGWLDTVVVWPGERVRILVDFAHEFAVAEHAVRGDDAAGQGGRDLPARYADRPGR